MMLLGSLENQNSLIAGTVQEWMAELEAGTDWTMQDVVE